jgi:hypothetical protein
VLERHHQAVGRISAGAAKAGLYGDLTGTTSAMGKALAATAKFDELRLGLQTSTAATSAIGKVLGPVAAAQHLTATTSAIGKAFAATDVIERHHQVIGRISAGAANAGLYGDLTATTSAIGKALAATAKFDELRLGLPASAARSLLEDFANLDRHHKYWAHLAEGASALWLPAERDTFEESVWEQAETGLWLPSGTDVFAAFVATIVFLWLLGMYLDEATRTGARLVEENRIGLLADLTWMCSAAGTAFLASRRTAKHVLGDRDDEV